MVSPRLDLALATFVAPVPPFDIPMTEGPMPIPPENT